MSVVLPPAGLLSTTLGRLRGVLAHVRLRPFDTSTAEGRAAERHRRVLLAALASALAKVISVSTGLISVPLTLHYLGVERYGMWMTMSSFAAILSFADLGMGNGLLSAVATAHGQDDNAAIRKYVSSGLAVLAAIAAGLLVLFAVVYPFVPWHKIFNVDTEVARREAGPAMAVFFVCFALALPTGVVQRVQMGLQRGFMASLWQCLASALALVGVLVAIHLEAGLPWLVLAFVGAPLSAALANNLMFFGRLHPEVAPAIKSISKEAAMLVARTGVLFLVLQLVVAVAYSSDSLVIAQTLGAASVAQYSVPERMFALISTVLVMVLAPLWPAYGEAIARGDRAWVVRTLKTSLTTAIGLAAVASTVLVLIGPWLIGLWVRHAVSPPFLLLAGMGVWKVLETGGNAISVFLNGARVIRFQVVTAILTAAGSISLKLLLVKEIGVAGTVWGSIIAFTVFSVVPLWFIVPKILARYGAPSNDA